MHLQSLLLAHYVLSGIAKGAPVDDMQSLSQSCENAANVLNASLNNTMALNTSSMIQSIVWQVGASTANLNQTSTSNGTSTTLDATYFSVCPESTLFNHNANQSQYIDSVRTLAEATIRRGRIFHQEMNLPVYNALKSLATVVQVCRTCACIRLLTNHANTLNRHTACSSATPI